MVDLGGRGGGGRGGVAVRVRREDVCIALLITCIVLFELPPGILFSSSHNPVVIQTKITILQLTAALQGLPFILLSMQTDRIEHFSSELTDAEQLKSINGTGCTSGHA